MSFKFKLAYFKHQLIANNRHGTHSPFVYKLADEVIYDYSAKKEYDELAQQLKKLLNDDSNIVIDNFTHIKIKIKNRCHGIAQLIFRLAKHHAPKNSLVLGVDFGVNTAYLAKAIPHANLIAIEECSTKTAIGRRVFKELNLNNVKLLVGDTNKILFKVVAEASDLDFVFFNGSYNKQTTLNYFNWCLPKLNEHSLLIIDDIYSNNDKKAAWAAIKNHPKVMVTVDLFWIGLVYFKKGQAKEHFKLKF